MRDLDEELWKLGIQAKTEHNEVAPAQHEIAPIFTDANIAADHDQLTMDMMKRLARKHDLVCLLHEKPFAGINGSGKHNNWSISTNKGVNLLEPGKTPAENAQFLLFLCAVIAAVDDYQELLRLSVASAGNDHRLGANEAPPAIISMFLGDELTEILESIERESSYSGRKKALFEVGVHYLPAFAKDTTDRNRTSPFAFTGNKFEFRMPGSSMSVSGPNTVLNTIVAEELCRFADVLECASDIPATMTALIKNSIGAHKRIIFNGNNYSEEWRAEAKRRGLADLASTPDALAHFLDRKNVDLFTKHGIFTKEEMESRLEILSENYCKTINIEALTMSDMAHKQLIPAAGDYAAALGKTYKAVSLCPGAPCRRVSDTLVRLSVLLDKMYAQTEALDAAAAGIKSCANSSAAARYCRDSVIPAMNELRITADMLEQIVGEKYWPLPTYCDLLFGV